MRTILRQTLTYEAQEDRLRLASDCDDGEVRVFWLTRRLADRLAGSLCQALEAGCPGETRLLRDSLLAWEQEAAQSALVPSPPVSSPGAAPTPQALVHTIDLVSHTNGQQLVFRASDGEDASLSLETPALRQWLGILHQAYLQGGWDTAEVWPDWMALAGGALAPSAPAGTVLH